MRSLVVFGVVFFNLLSFAAFSQAETPISEFSAWKLSEQETSLLQDRLKIRLPLNFKVEEPKKEFPYLALLTWQQGNNSVFVSVKESFEIPGENIESSLVENSRWMPLQSPQAKLFFQEGDFKVYQITSSTPEKNPNLGVSSYNLEALIPNNPTLKIAVFIKAENEKSFSEIEKIFRESFKTLKPGSRKINLTKRQELLETHLKDKKISLEIPENFLLLPYKNAQGAIESYSISPVKFLALGEKKLHGSLKIRFGVKEELSDMDPEYKEIQKPLFGKDQVWFEEKDEKTGVTLQFTSYPDPKTEKPIPQINVTLSALDAKTYPILDQIVQSMKLVEAK